MAKGDGIQDRLINFSVNIIALCNKLPRTYVGKHIAGQLMRSGTSSAPNYGEARGAESRKDFVHKLGIVLKELNETAIWLEILHRSNICTGSVIDGVSQECKELSKIINASIITTNKKKEN